MACVHHPDVIENLFPCSGCARSFCPDCRVWLDKASLCSECKTERVRDLISGLKPGELDIGTVSRRFVALMIDSFLTTLVVYAIIIPLALLFGSLSNRSPAAGTALSLVMMLVTYGVMFAVPVVYEGLMLQFLGRTLGKMALGLIVVTPDGTRISAGQAWGRAGLRLVLASCFWADYWPARFTRERTCLHDLIVKTRVARMQW